MDGPRFDALARSLAGGASRRGFLAGLGALAAGLAGGRRAGAACPAGQKFRRGIGCVCKLSLRPPVNGACPCRQDADCPAASDSTCGAAICINGACLLENKGAQCGPGQVCLDGGCGGNGVCTTAGGGGCGGDCGFGSRCDVTYEGGFVCVGSVPCDRNAVPCTSSAVCPPGYVCAVGGTCGSVGTVCEIACGAATAAATEGDRSGPVSGPTGG